MVEAGEAGITADAFPDRHVPVESTQRDLSRPAADPGLPAASMGEGAPPEGSGASEPAIPAVDEPAADPGLPMAKAIGRGEDGSAPEPMSAEELLFPVAQQPPRFREDAQLRAVIEAIIYVTEEPLSAPQIAAALEQPLEEVKQVLSELSADFEKPGHGIAIREVAGGYKMATKPEHHDAVRNFVKSLKPPLKLSLAALETLAVIAYKQPVTAPEIAEIRGVQGTGVLKTLLDRKLIAAAGRKNVIGKPILYKTTKDFLVQFGLKDLSELPSLKEFEEIRRMALSDDPEPEPGLGVAGGGERPVREPVGDPVPAEPPVEPPPGEEEPPVEPPPGEEEPAIEPPPSEQGPPKQAGQE
jgi:segregation and condensation protein B